MRQKKQMGKKREKDHSLSRNEWITRFITIKWKPDQIFKFKFREAYYNDISRIFQPHMTPSIVIPMLSLPLKWWHLSPSSKSTPSVPSNPLPLMTQSLSQPGFEQGDVKQEAYL